MLIEGYRIEVFTPPCDPGSQRYTAIAHLEADISECLPYLNAILAGAVYHPGARALTWKEGGHTFALHPHEAGVSNLEDRREAAREVELVIDLVNRTWARRSEIEPDETTHQRPSHLSLYELLPRTNCRRCGEPTCYTFALKLISGHRRLEDCAPLEDPACRAQRQRLGALLLGSGAPA
jgi:ArsR family metal-binding transcriptional regulator